MLIGTDGTDGASWPVSGDVVDIGGTEGAILLPKDPFLSPRHARIARSEGADGTVTWQILDLESVNGVYVKLRSPWLLDGGDLILLGQQVLRFDPVMDAEQGLGPATQHGTALFGTPQTRRLARLSQRTVEGITRDVFHIHRDETSLGRETADIVFTDDPFLSRRHALLKRDGSGRFQIEDLASSNGTFVAIRGRNALRDGDVFRVGLHMLRLDAPAGQPLSPAELASGASPNNAPGRSAQ